MAIAARSIAEGGPVGVLLLVTTPACRLHGPVFAPRVTLGAGDSLVLPLQGKLTHRVVVEAQMSALESRLTVTAGAGDALELGVVGRGVAAAHDARGGDGRTVRSKAPLMAA